MITKTKARELLKRFRAGPNDPRSVLRETFFSAGRIAATEGRILLTFPYAPPLPAETEKAPNIAAIITDFHEDGVPETWQPLPDIDTMPIVSGEIIYCDLCNGVGKLVNTGETCAECYGTGIWKDQRVVAWGDDTFLWQNLSPIAALPDVRMNPEPVLQPHSYCLRHYLFSCAGGGRGAIVPRYTQQQEKDSP